MQFRIHAITYSANIIRSKSTEHSRIQYCYQSAGLQDLNNELNQSNYTNVSARVEFIVSYKCIMYY